MELVASAPADGVTAPAVNRGLAELLGRERGLVLLLHEYWSAAVRDERIGVRYRKRQRALRTALAATLASRHARTGVWSTTGWPRGPAERPHPASSSSSSPASSSTVVPSSSAFVSFVPGSAPATT